MVALAARRSLDVEVETSAGFFYMFQGFQRRPQHRPLAVGVAGVAEGTAGRPADADHPRAPVAAVTSGITDSVTVDIPAFSISRAASPTDRQQNGHTGTSSTAPTSSLCIRSIIAGTLVRRNSSGFSR